MSASRVEDYFVKHGILGPNSTSEAANIIKKIQPDLDSAPYGPPRQVRR